MALCMVTGGAGFIGGHLARRLQALGHQVVVVDDLSNASYDTLPTGLYYNLPYDISTTRLWMHWIADMDVVFHCAAVSRTPPAITDPYRCMRVNVLGTQNLLEAIRGIAKKPRFVFSSSNIVYAGDTAYKVSKLAAEGLCQVYSTLYGVSTISLRYSNVYGPFIRKGDYAVFASLRDSALEKGYIEITGDGQQTRDFTHVNDIVEANLLAWEHSELWGIEPIDICTGVNTSLETVGGYFKRRGYEVRYVGERQGDVKHIRQDRRRAYDLLQWEPNIELKDGIKDIWQIER